MVFTEAWQSGSGEQQPFPHYLARAIRLIVLDIDGTIAGRNNQINPPVLAAIQAAQSRGLAVTIATGRMYCSAVRFHREIQTPLPLIAYQGAWMDQPDHSQPADRLKSKPLFHRPLDRTLAREVVDFLEEPAWGDRLSVHLYVNDRLLIRQLTPASQDYADRTGVTPIEVGDFRQVLDQGPDPTKVLALSPDRQLTRDLLEKLRQRYCAQEAYLTTSVSTFLEVAHPDVNKGNAVRHLAEQQLGLRPEQVMFVGDNFNDLEAIAYAGLGVAMGDAPEPVKAIAQWVAPSVAEDGAARAIEQVLAAQGSAH